VRLTRLLSGGSSRDNEGRKEETVFSVQRAVFTV
jgi:hypothetical protein